MNRTHSQLRFMLLLLLQVLSDDSELRYLPSGEWFFPILSYNCKSPKYPQHTLCSVYRIPAKDKRRHFPDPWQSLEDSMAASTSETGSGMLTGCVFVFVRRSV